MSNMESFICNHNANLSKDLEPVTKKECSCRQKPEHQLDEKCVSQCLVYDAIISKPTTDQDIILIRIDILFKINWEVASKLRPYDCSTKKCDLCQIEKLIIAKENPSYTLNIRDEYISKCRHMTKFTLKSFEK